MAGIIILLSLISQVDAQREKEWLIARLSVDLNFDESAISEVKKKLKNLSPTQVRVLVQVYKELKQREANEEANLEYSRQQAQNLQNSRIQAYRRHLNREFQYEKIVAEQEFELLRRANVYQRYMMQNFWPRGYYPHYLRHPSHRIFYSP